MDSVVRPRHITAPGVLLLRSLKQKNYSIQFYQVLVLTVTFIAYASYHASRKPPSIVKTVLHPQLSSLTLHPPPPPPPAPVHPWPFTLIFIPLPQTTNHSALPLPLQGNQAAAGWPPFDGNQGKSKLGEIDVAFLAAYACGMYFSGYLGDHLDLRVFLSVGMLGSAGFVCLFGLGYFWEIHAFSYYFVVQMMAGLFQATGWPSVVAIMGNWFGKSKRGLIMGIWNAHTSLGNVLGSLVAARMLQYGWGWSFLLPGLLLIMAGATVYLFLVVDPSDVDLPSPYEEDPSPKQDYSGGLDTVSLNPDAEADNKREDEADEWQKLLTSFTAKDDQNQTQDPHQPPDSALHLKNQPSSPSKKLQGSYPPDSAIGFFKAWAIPGVAQFALSLFFSKLVAYTFLYWLPFYIRNTKIAGEYLSDETAGSLSTLFDIGGVVGGILAGHISDHFNARAVTAAGFTFSAIPMLFAFNMYGGLSIYTCAGLMMGAGLLVNGPYALISTAVSADLGTHSSLQGNARALATVTAIIDGTGSVGAAVGPLLTGYISQKSWNNVFMMLMLAALLSGLLLSKLVFEELVEAFRCWRRKHSGGCLSHSLINEGHGEDNV